MLLRNLFLFAVLGLLGACTVPATRLTPAPLVDRVDNSQHCIVLLHGLARTSRSMEKMAQAFSASGYPTLNINYPSTEYSIDVLLSQYIAPAISEACAPDQYRLSFIGHSMGGILSRAYIAQQRPPKLGGLVMLAPPNHGSELVDKLGWLPPFDWINGPAGYELGTGKDAYWRKLPTPDYPALVIAGTFSTNPLYSSLIPGDDDGKVSVASAWLEGQAAFLTVSHTHTFLMNKADVIEAAKQFVTNPADAVSAE